MLDDIKTYHTATAGENWASVAFLYYKDEMAMQELMLANPDYVDLCVFEGGERLYIPNLQIEVTSAHLAPWRQ